MSKQTLIWILIVSLSTLFSIKGYAQDTEEHHFEEPEQAAIDSLKRLLSEYTPESVKVKLYYDIAAKYTNYDSVLKYNLLSLRTEEELKRQNDKMIHEEGQHCII